MLGNTGDYERVEDLPNLRLTSVDETHGADSLSRHKSFVSINSALSIDLTGQATSETVDGKTISASGGLTDFHRAALATEDGRAILALKATTKKGQSTIVDRHPAGTRISIGATEIDYVVTEFGIADLRFRDARARAAALARIAAPQYRTDLERSSQLQG
ncbi:MAG: acetyl-CoA hydrolase/transferase C-terminal domain-containing protein [Pseudomonadota bacterium]